MFKVLQLIQKNLIWSIPICMVLGLVYGFSIDPKPLKMLIVPFTFLMVYPMMVNLQIQKVFAPGDACLQLCAQGINFGIIPFVAFGLGKVFFSQEPLIALGLLLTALLPTSGMTISWTGFAKGNMGAAIKMTVVGLVIGSLAAPLYAKWLMGATVAIPLKKTFMQIAIVVFLPMLAGYATQRLLVLRYGVEKYRTDLKKLFPPFSTIGVLGIVCVAMALKAQTIIGTPSLFLRLLLPVMLLYFFNFVLSTYIGKYLFNRENGIALVYGTVMRNLSIALAIAMTVFGEEGADIALIIAIGYIVQVQAAAWYVRLTDTIFGPLEA